MPGAGRPRIAWVWKEKPPHYFTALSVVAWFWWMALMLSPYLLKYVTSPKPSVERAHAVSVARGVRYMNPTLWWCYDKGWRICGLLVLLLILIMVLKRDQIERVR